MELHSGSAGNLVQGNLIGTDVTGTAALPNWSDGVEVLGASHNTIGGTTPGAGNVISGNGKFLAITAAVHIVGSGATGNIVQGNLIGTDITGTADLDTGFSNTFHLGIRIVGSAGNTIGGTTAGARNVISGNAAGGVGILGSGATGNLVQGNLIGTDVTGTADLGNAFAGVRIDDASGISVGGIAAGAGNVIAFNGEDGVLVVSGTANALFRNSIHSNGKLGIDLFPPGITPNDRTDADMGANELQNFPVLTDVSIVSGPPPTTVIEGTLRSKPSTAYRIELFTNAACDPAGHGEGAKFLTAIQVTANAAGKAGFTTVVRGPHDLITATATDPLGNTSEF